MAEGKSQLIKRAAIAVTGARRMAATKGKVGDHEGRGEKEVSGDARARPLSREVGGDVRAPDSTSSVVNKDFGNIELKIGGESALTAERRASMELEDSVRVSCLTRASTPLMSVGESHV